MGAFKRKKKGRQWISLLVSGVLIESIWIIRKKRNERRKKSGWWGGGSSGFRDGWLTCQSSSNRWCSQMERGGGGRGKEHGDTKGTQDFPLLWTSGDYLMLFLKKLNINKANEIAPIEIAILASCDPFSINNLVIFFFNLPINSQRVVSYRYLWVRIFCLFVF